MKDETGYSNSNYTTTKSNKLGSLGVFFLITTIVLLGAGIFLFADNNTKAKEANSLTTELNASETRYADLDAKYASALADIESYKGKNAELDSVLGVKEKYITNLRANLNKEKKRNQISDQEYKAHLNDLNAAVTDLNIKVETLQQENVVLVNQKDSLGRDITQKVEVISGLQVTNSTLNQKVTVASLLIPEEITTSAVRAKSSGKSTTTSRAGKAQGLSVCFDLPENKVADAGSKIFLVRILDPQGSVLAVESQGSGVFTGVESNQQMQYTTSTSVDYSKDEVEHACVHWTQTIPYQTGHYTTEIYQDGYLVGKSGFDLK